MNGEDVANKDVPGHVVVVGPEAVVDCTTQEDGKVVQVETPADDEDREEEGKGKRKTTGTEVVSMNVCTYFKTYVKSSRSVVTNGKTSRTCCGRT